MPKVNPKLNLSWKALTMRKEVTGSKANLLIEAGFKYSKISKGEKVIRPTHVEMTDT